MSNETANELLEALEQIIEIAKKSQFQAVSLLVLRAIAEPVIKKAKEAA